MLWSAYISVGLFVALLGGMAVGRRARARSGAADDEGGTASDGIVYAVLGLLIAFTFTNAASRFDERRRLILQQSNALGTANLRLDVLPPDDRRAVREQLARWIRLALAVREAASDPERLRAALAEADRVQNEAWRLAVAAVERKQQPALNAFVLAPFNDWIDLTTSRLAMDDMGSPPMVMPSLVALALVASVLAGVSMKRRGRRDVLHMVAFAAAVAFSIYVIHDLNHPRSGLITVNAMDETMRQLLPAVERPTDGTK
ncbi:MAG: DUF4239 domain-containing protein [Phycisphaerae bacterium]|nr:hypothetical protein [Tepidisphaeraceae bacterium]